MQRYLLSFLLMLLAFLTQTVVVPYIRIFGVQPDLILVVAVCFSLTEGLIYGATAGFVGGFFEDLLLARYMGFNILTKTIIGSLTGLLKGLGDQERTVLPLIVIFGASLLSQAILAVLAFLFGETIVFRSIFGWRMFLTASYNALFTPFIYPVVLRLAKWQKGLAFLEE
ncbi:MAG: rod shape-determining protein MreD [Actinomycetota bacterium]